MNGIRDGVKTDGWNFEITSIVGNFILARCMEWSITCFPAFQKVLPQNQTFPVGEFVGIFFFREDRLLIHIKGGSTNANGATNFGVFLHFDSFKMLDIESNNHCFPLPSGWFMFFFP